MFINIQDPSDTQKSDLRRAIRSQAALSSASSRKSTLAAKAASSSSSSSSPSPEAINKLKRHQKPRGSRSRSKLLKVELGVMTTLPPQIHDWNSRTDPFRTFSTSGSWHEAMPHLVDIYLMHIATVEQDSLYSSNRPVLRDRFWPEIMSHSTLFYTSLLIATAHESFSGESSPELIAWFHHMAIRSIQDAINSSDGSATSDSTIAAVSLLAGRELEYGDDASFQTHLQGLITMVELRGGLDKFSNIARQIILSVTHNLLLYAGLQPVFDPAEFACRKWMSRVGFLDLPEGFANLARARLVFPATLDFVAELYQIIKRVDRKSDAFSPLMLRLAEYDYTDYLPVNYCPLQSADDDAINNQAEKHIRLALLCLMSRLQHSGPNSSIMSTASLHPEIFSGTVYAEVCTWALFIIGSTMPFPNDSLLRGLNRLVTSQGIKEWHQARQLLDRYFYPAEVLDSGCQALWIRLDLNNQARQEARRATRYNVGVFLLKQDVLADSRLK